MKTSVLILLMLLPLGSCGGDNSSSHSKEDTQKAPIQTPTYSQSWAEEFMELVNNHRVSVGRRPLVHREELAKIVLEHSQNMADKTVSFGHDGFSKRCSESRSAMGGGNWCGENVAYGQKTPEAAFNSWMNSSGHKANIEQSRATHTGFAYAKNANGTYYWTQIFLEL